MGDKPVDQTSRENPDLRDLLDCLIQALGGSDAVLERYNALCSKHRELSLQAEDLRSQMAELRKEQDALKDCVDRILCEERRRIQNPLTAYEAALE